MTIFKTKVLIILFFALILMSCDKDDPAAPQLNVSASEISFSADGGDTTITITCNDQWSISNSASSNIVSRSILFLFTSAFIVLFVVYSG